MGLLELMRKGSLRSVATATVATSATEEKERPLPVAVVAEVAVAKAPDDAANDTGLDPDRWCWPNGEAMNTLEIETFKLRVVLFMDRGVNLGKAEALADDLVRRDREGDDRRQCLECSNLNGGANSKRCSAWRAAGIGGQALSKDLIDSPQRCPGFEAAE